MADKLRKMLGDKNAPYTRPLLQLIEAQDKPTVCKWCLDKQHLMKITRMAINKAADLE